MPELPEVETIVREMREAGLEGKKILQAVIYWERSIALPEAQSFCERISKQTIQKISRRGKFLVFTLSKDTLLVHLRMTGKFLLSKKKDEPPHPHERIRLFLDDGRILRYEDQRKFGKWYLVSKPAEQLGALGLEPLSEEFTLEAFQKVLDDHHRQLKPFLLDQRYVAGLGNIYVDEALWEAKLHPLRLVSTLSKNERRLLHRAIQEVLRKGVENIGTRPAASLERIA
jgi:formamidopyrimidine-DNA glycosylase